MQEPCPGPAAAQEAGGPPPRPPHLANKRKGRGVGRALGGEAAPHGPCGLRSISSSSSRPVVDASNTAREMRDCAPRGYGHFALGSRGSGGRQMGLESVVFRPVEPPPPSPILTPPSPCFSPDPRSTSPVSPPGGILGVAGIRFRARWGLGRAARVARSNRCGLVFARGPPLPPTGPGSAPHPTPRPARGAPHWSPAAPWIPGPLPLVPAPCKLPRGSSPGLFS